MNSDMVIKSRVNQTRETNIYTVSVHFLSVCYAIYSILKLTPYFVWNSYENGMFYSIFGIQTPNFIGIIITAFAIFFLIFNHKIELNKFGFSLIVLLSAIFVFIISGRNDNVLFHYGWITYITLIVFIWLPDEIWKETFKVFCILFVISLIPGLIYYVLVNFLGANIPYTTLQSSNEAKVAADIYYHKYFFSCQIWSPWEIIYRYRFNAIYDEPGVVGTVSGLILGVNGYAIHSKKDAFYKGVLILSGILSFSLAFYLFVFIYFFIKGFEQKSTWKIFGLLAVLLAYIIFINIPFSNPIVQHIQQRMVLTDTGLSGDTRTNKTFDAYYDNFIDSSNALDLMFGKGDGAIEKLELRSQSYKNIVYDYGFVNLITFLVFIIVYSLYMITHHKSKAIPIFIVLVLILCNVYQRAGLYFFPYMMILLSGIKIICDDSTDSYIA